MGLTLPSPASCACSTAEQCLGSPGHLQYLTVCLIAESLGSGPRNVQGKCPVLSHLNMIMIQMPEV